MKTIAIFCGSSSNVKTTYLQVSMQLGMELAKRNVKILCGGGATGLMKSLIDGALEAGGNITGIVLKSENTTEQLHSGLTSVIQVDSVAERKDLMISSADAFITLPGSVGTLDEYFEVLASRRAGLHKKTCAILNIEGFYDHLFELFEHMIEEGFIKSKNKNLLIIESEIPSILLHLEIPPYSY